MASEEDYWRWNDIYERLLITRQAGWLDMQTAWPILTRIPLDRLEKKVIFDRLNIRPAIMSMARGEESIFLASWTLQRQACVRARQVAVHALRGNAHLFALSLAGTYPVENLEPEQYTELADGGHLHVLVSASCSLQCWALLLTGADTSMHRCPG